MKLKKVIGVIIGVTVISLYSNIAMAKTATVNTETLNLREKASTSANVLLQLDEGQKIEVLEDGDEWIKVKASGKTGYVSKQYVKISEDKSSETKANTEVKNTVVEETIKSENEQVAQENALTNEVTTETASNTIETTTTTTTTTTTSSQSQNTFKIKGALLNSDAQVYILPIINSSKIANLKKGASVTIMDEVNNWFYIQTEEISGWIRSNTINENQELEQTKPSSNEENSNATNNEKTNTISNTTANNEQTDNTTNTETKTDSTPKETEITKKTMYVNHSSVYVRKGPGTDYEVVDSLILNDSVTVTAESGDWYKVKTSETDGYIAKRLLSGTSTSRNADERIIEENNDVKQEEKEIEFVETSSKGEEIVNYAKQFLGCKYVYGGAGPSTFDCSGFTMYVFKHFGINLSHSANAQSKNGSYVSKSDLKPGDLVFFKDYQTMDGIGHCGIYVGNGDFIHASSGTGYCVKISTLLTGSYNTRYETARRIDI